MVVEVRTERFLHVALFCTGPFSTSYKEKKLKLKIRDHLLALTAEFPTFKLTMDPFYGDGVTKELLKATGVLPCFNIHIIIWIPLSYPLLPPILYLSSSTSSYGLPFLHPYVDQSTGLVTIPYLTMWDNKRSKLTELVRNLVRILNFSNSSSIGHASRFSSLPSRREAIDRLAIHLLNDLTRFNGEVKEEKDKVLIIRSRLKERAIMCSNMVSESKYELIVLQKKTMETKRDVERVTKWMEGVDISKLPPLKIEEAFQVEDEKSKVQIEHKAVGDAIYETVRKMEEAMAKGVIPLDVYLKQVRVLELEQFKHKSILMEVNMEPRFFF